MESRSDSAREVHLGIKKVLSYEQEAILPVRCMFRIKNGVLYISPKLQACLYARAVRHILKLVFISAILMSSVSAVGTSLIGSGASFADSLYCIDFACKFLGKIPITTSFTEYRYRVVYAPRVQNPGSLIVSVFRYGDTVASIGFAVDGQDVPFSAGNPKGMLPALELFRVATGVSFSATAFLNLQNSCDHFTVMLGVFKLTCSTSSDTFDAQRWNYRIFR